VPKKSKPRDLSTAILDCLYRPVDAASMVVVRIVFGLLMSLLVARLFLTGGLERYYLAQDVRFKYPLFGWVPDAPDTVMLALFAAVGVAGLFVAAGLFYRAAIVVLAACWSYIFFVDRTPYQNHDYLSCLLGLLFVFMPLHRMFSFDARLHPAMRRDFIPAWCLYLFRFQIAVVYIFGGIRKLNPDWLRGEPIRTMLHSEAFEHPIVGAWFFSEPLVMTFAYGGLLLDLLIVPALLWRRTRIPAFLAAAAFHLTNAWLWDIDVFPWFMIAATLTFFPPDYPRKVVKRLDRARTQQDSVRPSYSAKHKLGAGLIALYAIVQLIVPARPALNPGHLLEQDDLLVFSWNMMLRVRSARAEFIVVNNETGERRVVLPEQLLSSYQQDAVIGSPDMLHQLAKHIAEREGGNVSVHVNAHQSVHARPWHLIVDPSVDLANTPRMLGPKPWVMPFVERHPPDPAKRSAFYRAKWRFCKAEGYLPFTKNPNDPKAAARLQEWTEKYRQER
jgi:vitamin K-dependent gamma-carboxylase